jgi:hypothetical protein
MNIPVDGARAYAIRPIGIRLRNDIGGMSVLWFPLTSPGPALSPLSRRRGGEKKAEHPKG